MLVFHVVIHIEEKEDLDTDDEGFTKFRNRTHKGEFAELSYGARNIQCGRFVDSSMGRGPPGSNAETDRIGQLCKGQKFSLLSY